MKYIPHELWMDDKKYLLNLMEKNVFIYNYDAIRENIVTFPYKESKKYIEIVLENEPRYFLQKKYIPTAFMRDVNLWAKLVIIYPQAIKFNNELEIIQNKEMMKQVMIFTDASLFRFCSGILKADKEFVIFSLEQRARNQNKWSVFVADTLPRPLLCDKDVMSLVIQVEPTTIYESIIPSSVKTREFVLFYIRINPYVIWSLEKDYKNDFEIMTKACLIDSTYFMNVSFKLKKAKYICE